MDIGCILLGAATFPGHPELSSPPSFEKSARDLSEYLLASDGLQMPPSRLLNLFDSEDSPLEIHRRILDWVKTVVAEPQPLKDLLVYYIGHGGFLRGREYFLALKSTLRQCEGVSSLRMSDLATTLTSAFAGVPIRNHIILDCCFAASAFQEFQSAPVVLATLQAAESFPERGTNLLCASSAKNVALAPQRSTYTMFSGAFLSILQNGSAGLGPKMSLRDVHALAVASIKQEYGDSAVLPELHSPRQADGSSVSLMPLFPNPGYDEEASSQTTVQATQHGQDGAVMQEIVKKILSSVEQDVIYWIYTERSHPYFLDDSRIYCLKRLLQVGLLARTQAFSHQQLQGKAVSLTDYYRLTPLGVQFVLALDNKPFNPHPVMNGITVAATSRTLMEATILQRLLEGEDEPANYNITHDALTAFRNLRREQMIEQKLDQSVQALLNRQQQRLSDLFRLTNRGKACARSLAPEFQSVST